MIDTAPTCGSTGVRHQECKNCDAVQAEGTVIDATGVHQTEIVGAKAATATENGFTGDEVCTVCGQTIRQGEVIPATGAPEDSGVCPICGKTHTGGVINVLLGEFHWWLSVLQKILRSFGG